MKLLSKLKPAETLLLLDKSNADFKNLLKYIFMDLVLKQVLVVKESSKIIKSSSGNTYKKIKTKYVIKGKNFDYYNPSPYETIYLSVFQKSPELKAVLTKLIKVAYDIVYSEKKYRNSILNSYPIKQHFKTSVILQSFGVYSLTKQGKSSKAKIKITLDKIDIQIGELLKNNQKEALKILLEIGGNIFLLKNLDFTLLHKIDRSIIQSININNQLHPYDDNRGWWYNMDFSDINWLHSTFYLWDDTFDTFDSGYDSAGCSSYDNGCSSCSGCSGCSGCN